MKFGDNKSPSTASFILNPGEQDKRPRIAHLTGLGFKEGALVVIERKDDKLIFEGEASREIENGSMSFIVKKIETYIDTKEVFLRDIQSVDFTDESGRSLGKTALWGVIGGLTLGPLGLIGGAMFGGRKRYKSYLVIQIKPENGIPYPIILGRANQKEMRKYYEHLISIVN